MWSSLLTIIIFLGAWILTWLPIALPLAKLINYQLASPLTIKQKILFLVSLYPLAPLIIWLIIKHQGLTFSELGINRTIFLSWGSGLILAVVTLAIVFYLESVLGLVNWHWQNRPQLLTTAPAILVLALVIGVVEELIFRGFMLSELVKDDSYWLAAIISSLLFALLHLVWERKTTLPQIPGLWLMGMVLVGARLADRGNLGLAWGLHTGWIWGLSCLNSAEILSYKQPERVWLTGINQQPLAGAAGIFCLLITGVFLYLKQTLLEF
ncbi:MAG TPA: lysostaphin resistance A-like protein [Xenococcaceae cyanobacterium]